MPDNRCWCYANLTAAELDDIHHARGYRDGVRAERARCVAIILGEMLTDETSHPTDEAYNRALDDALRAIQPQARI